MKIFSNFNGVNRFSRMKKIVFFLSSVLCISVVSCQSEEVPASDVPVIQFVKLKTVPFAYGDTVLTTIKYEDKSSDLGWEPNGTFPYLKEDFFAKLFRKKNGRFTEWVSPDTFITFNGFLPYVESVRPSKYDNGPFRVTVNSRYRGEIEWRVPILPLGVPELPQYLQPGDTLRFEIYEIYIEDRAGNVSNTITTPEFVLMQR